MTKFYPLVPNWATPLRETYEFNTNIIMSRDGQEQRRALRNNPRLTISFQSIADGERRRTLERLFQTDLGQIISLPDYTRHVKTTTALPASGNSVVMVSVPVWMTEGATVALCARRDVVVMEIDTIVGTTVTFTTLTDKAWPISTKVRPLIEGRIKRAPSVALDTDTIGQTTLTFDVTPGIYTFDATDDDIQILGNYEILSVRPNWADRPQIGYERQYDEVDYGFGRTAFYSPVEFATRTAQATYTNRSAEMTDWMKRFFLRRKGMRGEFWAPSWSDDMTLVSAPSGSQYITVAGRGVYDAYALSMTNRAIWVRLEDNSWRAFELELIDLVGSDSRLKIIGTLAETISPSNVKQICWLYRTRFASDSLTVEWTTDAVSRIGYQAQSIAV